MWINILCGVFLIIAFFGLILAAVGTRDVDTVDDDSLW